MRQRVTSFIETKFFQLFIVVVILVNAAVIGVQTTSYAVKYEGLLTTLDIACLVVYTVEAVLKIYAHRVDYFKDGWNIFDFAILLMCYMPANSLPVPAAIARMVRVFRVVRVFRLVSAFKQIRVIIEGLGRSFSGVIWTAILLGLIYYIFAVVGVHMYGKSFPEWFGDLGEAMYTLFQLMTLESWSMGIARPVMDEYPASWIYFVSFVVISSFVVVNVVVGIIIGAIDDARNALNQEEEHERRLAQDHIDRETELREEIAALRQQMLKVEALLAEHQKKK